MLTDALRVLGPERAGRQGPRLRLPSDGHHRGDAERLWPWLAAKLGLQGEANEPASRCRRCHEAFSRPDRRRQCHAIGRRRDLRGHRTERAGKTTLFNLIAGVSARRRRNPFRRRAHRRHGSGKDLRGRHRANLPDRKAISRSQRDGQCGDRRAMLRAPGHEIGARRRPATSCASSTCSTSAAQKAGSLTLLTKTPRSCARAGHRTKADPAR